MKQIMLSENYARTGLSRFVRVLSITRYFESSMMYAANPEKDLFFQRNYISIFLFFKYFEIDFVLRMFEALFSFLLFLNN